MHLPEVLSSNFEDYSFLYRLETNYTPPNLNWPFLFYAHLMWVNHEKMQISAIYLWGLCEKPGGSFPNSWWRMLKSASLSEYNVGVGVLGHFAANQNWALGTGDGPSKAELRQKHDPRPGLMSREGGRERLLAATCFWINVNKDKISGSYLYYVILANIHHWSSWGCKYAAKSESVFNMP